MEDIVYREWTVAFRQGQNGWINIKASREIDAGVRRVKKRDGGWAMVSAARTRFHLAWNGERFADGPELKTICKKHKALFGAICRALRGVGKAGTR